MATKKKSIDQKTIAKKQSWEIRYVCDTWFSADGKKVSKDVVNSVVKKIGRSRRAVYAVLRYLGYTYKAKTK